MDAERTREIVHTLDEVRLALRAYGREDLCDDLGGVLTDLESDAFHNGLDLAAGIHERESTALAELMLQCAARVAGKDRADGIIRFEVYPDPGIYGWSPTEDRGYDPREDEYIAQEDARLGYGPQTGNGPQD